MLQNIRLIEWEKRLKSIFDGVNDELETKYGHLFPLHPARAGHATTSDRTQDGLFNIGASFTLGIGSRFGPGCAVDIRLSTLSHVPDNFRRQIKEEVVMRVSSRLPDVFSQGTLDISRDGGIYKIHGNLGF